MPRPTTNKIPKTITFDPEVLRYLEARCRKEGITITVFVNDLVKKAVMSEFEYYRNLCKFYSSKMYEYQKLMETSPDRPR